MRTQGKNWIWMSDKGNHISDDEWYNIFSHLKEAGISGVNFSGQPQAIDRILNLTRDLDMELFVWIFTMINNEPETLEELKDSFMVNREGISSRNDPPYVGYYRWLCPNHQETVDLLLNRIENLCSIPDLTGIHLDYIRYPDVILPQACQKIYGLDQQEEESRFDFCYCDRCRELFKAEYGYDPQDLSEPSKDVNWLQFRYNSISRIVSGIAEKVRSNDKLITAAVFPTPGIAKKLVRQDWLSWNLDGIFPMIYHNFYYEDLEWIGQAVKEDVEAVKGKYPLYCGVYLPEIDEKELETAVKMAEDNGASGLSLFDHNAFTSGRFNN
jgi:uncharacterized lipoprotein YddW (UPF0748 family)